MTEMRVYAIDDFNLVKSQGFNRDKGDNEKNWDEATDDEVMDVAEAQGNVWDLTEFQNAFNAGYVSDEWYIRFIEVEI